MVSFSSIGKRMPEVGHGGPIMMAAPLLPELDPAPYKSDDIPEPAHINTAGIDGECASMETDPGTPVVQSLSSSNRPQSSTSDNGDLSNDREQRVKEEENESPSLLNNESSSSGLAIDAAKENSALVSAKGGLDSTNLSSRQRASLTTRPVDTAKAYTAAGVRGMWSMANRVKAGGSALHRKMKNNSYTAYKAKRRSAPNFENGRECSGCGIRLYTVLRLGSKSSRGTTSFGAGSEQRENVPPSRAGTRRRRSWRLSREGSLTGRYTFKHSASLSSNKSGPSAAKQTSERTTSSDVADEVSGRSPPSSAVPAVPARLSITKEKEDEVSASVGDGNQGSSPSSPSSRPRHHCRNCGRSFCARCAGTRIPLPDFGIYYATRVCNGCIRSMQMALEERRVNVGVIQTGFLKKQRPYGSSWQLRYVILTNVALHYFRPRKGGIGEERGCIMIEDMQSISLTTANGEDFSSQPAESLSDAERAIGGSALSSAPENGSVPLLKRESRSISPRSFAALSFRYSEKEVFKGNFVIEVTLKSNSRNYRFSTPSENEATEWFNALEESRSRYVHSENEEIVTYSATTSTRVDAITAQGEGLGDAEGKVLALYPDWGAAIDVDLGCIGRDLWKKGQNRKVEHVSEDEEGRSFYFWLSDKNYACLPERIIAEQVARLEDAKRVGLRLLVRRRDNAQSPTPGNIDEDGRTDATLADSRHGEALLDLRLTLLQNVEKHGLDTLALQQRQLANLQNVLQSNLIGAAGALFNCKNDVKTDFLLGVVFVFGCIMGLFSSSLGISAWGKSLLSIVVLVTLRCLFWAVTERSRAIRPYVGVGADSRSQERSSAPRRIQITLWDYHRCERVAPQGQSTGNLCWQDVQLLDEDMQPVVVKERNRGSLGALDDGNADPEVGRGKRARSIEDVDSDQDQEIEEDSEQECQSEGTNKDVVGRVPHRFLVGALYDEEKARSRFTEHLEWRKQNQVDNLVRAPQPYFDLVKSCYSHYFHGRDKSGRIVLYERAGMVADAFKKLRAATVPPSSMLMHYVFLQEYLWGRDQDQGLSLGTREDGADDPRESVVRVMDMKGIGMSDVSGALYDFIREAARCVGVHYPERLHVIFVINVPSWFNVLFKMVSPLLDEATRRKVRIFRGGYEAALAEYIDPDQIPKQYGGTCDCQRVELTEASVSSIKNFEIAADLAQNGRFSNSAGVESVICARHGKDEMELRKFVLEMNSEVEHLPSSSSSSSEGDPEDEG